MEIKKKKEAKGIITIIEGNYVGMKSGDRLDDPIEDSKKPEFHTSENKTNNQVFKDIYKRISELKRMVIEDGDEYPDEESEKTFNNFISIFNLTKLPEITIDEYGLYYLRIVKDNKKLVMLFLADGNIQYLIEHFNEHIEQINSPKFIYNIFEKFIIEMI